MTKKKVKTPKTPETHPIYTEMDDKMKEKVAEIESKQPKPLELRVAGVSFADYAEVKYLGGDGVHDPFIQKSMNINIDKNYRPQMTQQPINVTRNQEGVLTVKPYTAAELKKMGAPNTKKTEIDIFSGAVTPIKEKIIWPKYYQNPYQFQDYVYLQDIYANTICGRIFDVLGYFALANGIKPKLRVRNESAFDNDEAKQNALKDHQWMIDALEEIERNISTSSTPTAFGAKGDTSEYPVGPIATAESPSTPTYDTPLQAKWFAAFINKMMFGRDMIVPRIDPDDNEVNVMENGKEETYKNIPKIMLVIHPRDMGFNYVDYMTHRLLGIQLNNSNWILRPDEMIFFENKPDNPVYGSKFYGMAEAQSMMGSARTLRRIIEVDFPLIAKTRWSGMYWLVFKRKGEGTGTSDEELRKILANIELNGINATLEDEPKDDFMLHKIDLDPKIEGLLQTVKDLIAYMMSQVGIPQGLLYGEQDLNRDTLKSKIGAWTKGSLKKYREPFLQAVTDQWYRRLVKTLEDQSEKWKEGLKLFEVYADVDEFKLDSREELLNALMILENITGAWTDEARARFLEMENLQQNIDPDKDEMDIPPMPGGSGGFNVKDNQSGQEFGVSKSP